MINEEKLARIAKSIVADETQPVYVMHCFNKTAQEYDHFKGTMNGDEFNVGVDRHMTVQDKDLKKCVEKACDLISTDYDTSMMAVYGNNIDIEVYENAEGDIVSEAEKKDWREGAGKLYLCRYKWSMTMKVEQDVDEGTITQALGI